MPPLTCSQAYLDLAWTQYIVNGDHGNDLLRMRRRMDRQTDRQTDKLENHKVTIGRVHSAQRTLLVKYL